MNKAMQNQTKWRVRVRHFLLFFFFHFYVVNIIHIIIYFFYFYLFYVRALGLGKYNIFTTQLASPKDLTITQIFYLFIIIYPFLLLSVNLFLIIFGGAMNPVQKCQKGIIS